MDSHPPRKIGLTGGIASGKSTVARWIREKGLTVIDLDQVGKHLTDSDPEVLKSIGKLAGAEVLRGGQLDRAKARQIFFSNPKLRAKLEKLLHPKIEKRFEQMVSKAEKRGEKVVFCEAALLFESGYADELDEIVLVVASTDLQKKRALSRDKMTEQLVGHIFKSQWSDEKKIKKSDHVLRNVGSLEDLKQQVETLLTLIRSQPG